MGYIKQIKEELQQRDWTIVAIDVSDAWWDDENWTLQWKYHPEIFCFLCFIVDPQFEGARKKGQGIARIKACSKFPENWNDTSSLIAEIDMLKGRFDLKLKEFIPLLENYKLEKKKAFRKFGN